MNALLSAAAEAGIAARAFRASETDAIAAAPGAYALAIRLDHALDTCLAGREPIRLAPGWYVYCGSAKGPGGLRARLARHLRAGKRPHWHVDRLTEEAGDVAALPVRDADECELVALLLRHRAFDIAVEGFGSTDCAACRSHLLRYVR